MDKESAREIVKGIERKRLEAGKLLAAFKQATGISNLEIINLASNQKYITSKRRRGLYVRINNQTIVIHAQIGSEEGILDMIDILTEAARILYKSDNKTEGENHAN